MKRISLLVAAGSILVLGSTHPASAVEVSSTFSGGLYASGTTTPGFMNYYVGYAVPSTPIERRNYFIFDLTGVSGEVASASLKLYLPGGSMPSGYISSDATEDYRISGSAFAWTAFAEAFGGTAPPPMLAAMFGTMGVGPAYGVTTLSIDSGGMDVVIDLSPAAISAINLSLGSHFLVTGRLTDLHPLMPGTPPAELAFAYTDIPSATIPMPRLEMVMVPGPGGGVLIVIAVVCGVRRRRHDVR